jgi:hypothetical protein
LGLILEVKEGPVAGQQVVVRTGETKRIGRAAAQSDFALPQDTFMSGLHFTVDCSAQGCRLTDKSRNGTFLNGAKVAEAMLASGDEVRSGKTVFSVRLVADEKLPGVRPAAAPPAGELVSPAPPAVAPPPQRAAPKAEIPRPAEAFHEPDVRAAVKDPPPAPAVRPPAAPVPPVVRPPASPVSPVARPIATPLAPPTPQVKARSPEPARQSAGAKGKAPLLTVGVWTFSVVPQGWEVKDEFGLQRTEKDVFPSNVTATEEMLGGEAALQPFVESQVSMLRQYLRDPKIEAILPPVIPGAEEKASFDVRYATKDGQTIFYRRVYARSGKIVGTLTLTTLESDLQQTRAAFEEILAGVTFQKKERV